MFEAQFVFGSVVLAETIAPVTTKVAREELGTSGTTNNTVASEAANPGLTPFPPTSCPSEPHKRGAIRFLV
jgi:hypothetical protein